MKSVPSVPSVVQSRLRVALHGLATAAEAAPVLVSDLDWTRASEHLSKLINRLSSRSGLDGRPRSSRLKSSARRVGRPATTGRRTRIYLSKLPTAYKEPHEPPSHDQHER